VDIRIRHVVGLDRRLVLRITIRLCRTTQPIGTHEAMLVAR
jgi:hypothetical protein